MTKIIRDIPSGEVLTYGQAAAMAGNPRGALQTARLLHAASRSRNLPWHRVVSAGGYIRTPEGTRELHRQLLQQEGVVFAGPWQVDMSKSGR